MTSTTKRISAAALPFVFVNMAMSADGKIATANRLLASFGTPYDQRHLLRLRSQADAVMVGARTADLNPINLGPGPARFRHLRLQRGLAEYNLRVIVSGSGTIDPGAEIFQHRFSPVLILTTKRASADKLELLRALADEVRICGQEAIDFRAALQWLRERWQVKRLLCEGGGELNGALFAASLVHELHLTLCPKILGGGPAPTIADGQGALNLAAATRLELRSVRRVGDELFLTYQVITAKDL